MSLIRALCSALLLFTATPVWAQLTATYGGLGGDFQMRVEISPTGDLRGMAPGQPVESMTIKGESFMIETRDGITKVYRVSDMAVVFAEIAARNIPANFPDAFKDMPALEMEERGTLTINGRTGRAYYLREQAGEVMQTPAAVISDDPALAPLGVAMAKQFDISMMLMPPQFGSFAKRMKPMADLLHTGAPLSFAGSELREVSTAPIPPERFILPAPPQTLDQVRARIVESGGRFP